MAVFDSLRSTRRPIFDLRSDSIVSVTVEYIVRLASLLLKRSLFWVNNIGNEAADAGDIKAPTIVSYRREINCARPCSSSESDSCFERVNITWQAFNLNAVTGVGQPNIQLAIATTSNLSLSAQSVISRIVFN